MNGIYSSLSFYMVMSVGAVDNLFVTDSVKKFEFSSEVAEVFDDMIGRSVPFYHDIMDLSASFIVKNARGCPTIYDLGCSTASFLIRLEPMLRVRGICSRLVGIDNSKAMISKALQKASGIGSNIELVCCDLLSYRFGICNFAISQYTMQFINPSDRLGVVSSVFDSLEPGGFFIMAEKTVSSSLFLETQMTDIYYDYKRKMGYSNGEIYRKRDALEDVLVPYSLEENISMLKSAGFKAVEILFKWVNFVLLLAVK